MEETDHRLNSIEGYAVTREEAYLRNKANQEECELIAKALKEAYGIKKLLP
jgi:hypothetical protein